MDGGAYCMEYKNVKLHNLQISISWKADIRLAIFP